MGIQSVWFVSFPFFLKTKKEPNFSASFDIPFRTKGFCFGLWTDCVRMCRENWRSLARVQTEASSFNE